MFLKQQFMFFDFEQSAAENMENTEDAGMTDTVDNSETEATKTLENMAEDFVLIPGGLFRWKVRKRRTGARKMKYCI